MTLVLAHTPITRVLCPQGWPANICLLVYGHFLQLEDQEETSLRGRSILTWDTCFEDLMSNSPLKEHSLQLVGQFVYMLGKVRFLLLWDTSSKAVQTTKIQTSYWEFLFHLTFTPQFPEFSAVLLFGNSIIFGFTGTFQGNLSTILPILKFSKFLVEWELLRHPFEGKIFCKITLLLCPLPHTSKKRHSAHHIMVNK